MLTQVCLVGTFSLLKRGLIDCAIGPAYVMCMLSWIISLLVTVMIIVNGWAADKGYPWAVGNRRYEPIR